MPSTHASSARFSDQGYSFPGCLALPSSRKVEGIFCGLPGNGSKLYMASLVYLRHRHPNKNQ